MYSLTIVLIDLVGIGHHLPVLIDEESLLIIIKEIENIYHYYYVFFNVICIGVAIQYIFAALIEINSLKCASIYICNEEWIKNFLSHSISILNRLKMEINVLKRLESI